MLPSFSDMLAQLVAEPSVSSTSPDIDRSNLRVIEHLANWLNDLGFRLKLMPLPNWAVTQTTAWAVSCLPATRIPCRSMKRCGNRIGSRSKTTRLASPAWAAAT